MLQRRPGIGRWGSALLIGVLWIAPMPSAQAQDNPVYVNDSPQAWEQFRRARDLSKDNVSEAVRLYQELLDDYGTRLIPMQEAGSSQFASVRSRALSELRRDEALLDAYGRLEGAQAQRLLDTGKSERLVLTRSLTGPGLSALLGLAQADLEAGRFHSAIHRAHEAEEHPAAQEDDRAAAIYVECVAEHYLRDDTAAMNAQARLDRLTGARAKVLRESLGKLMAGVPAPASRMPPGLTVMDVVGAADLDQMVGEPIWSKPLDHSLFSRLAAEASDGAGAEGRGRELDRIEGRFLTIAPTVAGSVVYVNEGHRLRAFNRFTEGVVWTFPESGAPPPIDREIAEVGDMNVMAVAEGVVVSLTGHATRDARSGPGAVICLDAQTGAHRWTVRVDRLSSALSARAEAGRDEEFAGLFPFGSPVISEGLVFILARKTSAQQLTSTYLLALALEDGSVRWSMHVASCGGLQSRMGRPYSCMTCVRGDLYLADALGAMARIEAATGVTVWLRRFTAPINPFATDLRPWEISGPMVTDRGVLAIQPDGTRVVLLDAQTGDLLEGYATGARSSTGWGEPRYMMADASRVYVVGRENIRAFDLHQLTDPVWMVRQGASRGGEEGAVEDRGGRGEPQRPAERGPPAGRGGMVGREPDAAVAGQAIVEIPPMRGRVQLTETALVVPTIGGIMIVDNETGRLVNRLVSARAGNPLACGGQLLVATEDRLDAYMPLLRAQQMLRERFAASPSDPEPMLALVRLGMRARDLKLCLEAAERAWPLLRDRLGSAERQPEGPLAVEARRQHEDLFDLLMAIDTTQMAATIEQGESLHALIGSIATTPPEQLRHLLAYGDWLATRRLEDAIEAYQTVGSNRVLAQVDLEQGDVHRSGGAWAAQRINDLMARHGASVYARERDFARHSLELMLSKQDATPDRLLELAREFPLSEAAVDACLRASEQAESNGQRRQAVGALTTAVWSDQGSLRTAPACAALVRLYLKQGWTSLAGDALEQARMMYEGRVAIDDWAPPSSVVNRQSLKSRQPRVGEPAGSAQWVAGQLLAVHPSVVLDRRADAALFMEGTTLRLMSVSDPVDFTPLWAVELNETAVQLLQLDEETARLWLAGNPADPRMMSLSAKDGTVRWITPRMGDQIAGGALEGAPGGVAPAAPGNDGAIQLADGQFVSSTEVIPLLGRDRIVFVRRTGAMVAFDAGDGRTELWRRPSSAGVLSQVHQARWSELGIVVSGSRVRAVPAAGASPGAGATGQEPVILVLDPLTGATLFEWQPLGGEPVRWQAISPWGAVAYGSGAGIEVMDLLSGERLWASTDAAVRGTRGGWWWGRTLLAADNAGGIQTLQASNGTLGDPLQTAQTGESRPRELRDLRLGSGRVLVQYSDRVIVFDQAGRRVGTDVITDERDYRWLFTARAADGQDRLVLFSQLRPMQLQMAERPGRITSYNYWLYTLAEDGRLLWEPRAIDALPAPVRAAVLLDGVLLLSMDSSPQPATLAIRMPPSP